jgi:methylenetetrahydrofolate dehydrogenase (NADP+)/methenyltetrahydrofolate cyclohydrolase
MLSSNTIRTVVLGGLTCYNAAMKLLSGRELSGYIKERQAHQVRGLRQAWGVQPKLAIVVTVDHPAINVYVRKKEHYGADIGIAVETYRVPQADAPKTIGMLNKDDTTHGIIVQLPLEDPDQTEEIVNLVDPKKDVDALGMNATFDPATPMAILWLLAGYNIDLQTKRIVLVGRGRLVGAPLERELRASGFNVASVDKRTENMVSVIREADIIISATGSPSILKSDMIKQGAVVVDAGVAGEQGKTSGDLDPAIYEERDDLIITPAKGGVGPLTVCALFENVIRAARPADSEAQL